MLSFIQSLFKANKQTKSDKVTTPAPDLHLYHFTGCPFCRSVRKQIELLNLDIELRNIYSDESYLNELLEGGGRRTVPCLRIEHSNGKVQWMYESIDIAQYLQKRFS